jgi:HEAT repeat protein
VARALSGAARPDPEWIPLLFRLVGPDRALTEAATQALATYRTNPDVTARLVNLANARAEREPTRVAAIRALGTMPDKSAAGTLVGLLSRNDESPGIAAAAADALVDLTGLRDNGHDVQKWRQWWAENEERSDADFRQALLTNQASRFDQLLLRHRQLEDELASLLSDQYQLAPDAQKPDLLLRYLKSPEPAIRTTGARLVFDDAVNNRTIPPGVVEQVRSMIGDSSPDVRVAVADALRAVNDTSALTPLLTQLAQEREDSVRAAIARALGASGDLRALAPLRKLLRDPSLAVAQAAADAVRELGPKVRDGNPVLAKETAEELRQVLDERAGEPGSQALRESLVLAMAPLREPSLLPVYYKVLRLSSEAGPVRRAAVKALGELRRPEAADVLVNLLDDPDATVRLEAVEAIGKSGTFQHADAVYRRLSPSAESDRSVRERAWQVLEGMFPTMPAEQLSQWAERFADDPGRRLVVLAALADRQAKDGNRAEPLAYTRKALGETLMSLNRPADAAPYFRQSLGFWGIKDPKGMMAVGVSQELMTALLRAKQYPAAVAFGGELLSADLSNQQLVGPAIRGEAQRLVDANDLSGAQSLIVESRRMVPPLDARYTQALAELEAEVRRRVAEAGRRRKNGPRSAAVDVVRAVEVGLIV